MSAHEEQVQPAREPEVAYAGAKPPASSRRLGRGRKLLYGSLAPVLACFLWMLFASLRWRVRGREQVEARLASGEPMIPCFWHQHLVSGLGFLRFLRGAGMSPCLLISPSVDGEFATQIVQHFGGRVVRGSATRTGVRAFLGLHRALVETQASPVIPPDGPQGPPQRFKKGAVALSRRGGAPVLLIGISVRPCLRLPTWDRMELPLPFARVDVQIGAPEQIVVDEDASEARRLSERLCELDARAASGE